MGYIEEQVSVEKLKELYMSGEYEIEIHTPDGWNKITNWFDKGELDMVLIKMDSGKSTRCAYNHLVQLASEEWVLASEVEAGQVLLTVDGEEIVDSVEHLDKKEECFDFTVDHPNHRYYGDGISSHNSGKSYLASGNIVRECQEKGITPIILDTENALDEEWLQRIGVDTSPDKLMRFPVAMINDVGKIMSLFIEDYKANYMDLPLEERPKFMIIIDSLGMLLTDTDVDQFNKGDMKGDMGRKPKQLNALVRNIINKIADCNIGVVCTNHTYASQDMFNPDDKVSGGEGIIFASSIVVASRKFKLKEDEDGNKTTDVLGIRSTFSVMKTRYGRPFEKANLNIRFDTGLDMYSGLLDYFERIGVVTKDGNKLKYIAKDGTEFKEFRKNFSNEILQRIIDEWDYEKYKLISSKTDVSESELEELEEQSVQQAE